jgi:hypothetical protein
MASDCPAKNQRMDVVRPTIGVHRLQIYHVPHDIEVLRDPIPTQNVPAVSCDVQRLAGGVAL